MTEKFEEWAILELMGHRRLAGKVSEAVIFGGSLLRIDIPGNDNTWQATQYYSVQSIYCITPVAEDIARAMAKQLRPEPVHRWEIKDLALPVPGDSDRQLSPDGWPLERREDDDVPF